MSAPQSLIKSVLQINFGVPAALATDTVGTDSITGVTEFTPKTQNVIKDVRMAVDSAAGLNFVLLTRRLDEKRKTIGFTPDFITTNVRKPSAIGDDGLVLNAGFLQFVEQQLAGALTAQNYLITLLQPLNV